MSAHHQMPTSWRRADLAIATAGNVLLSGLPGTGKSLAARSLVHPAGRVAPEDIFNLTIHDEMPVGDIIGNYLPRLGKWDWRHGPASNAWIASHDRPVRVVFNEVDAASGAVLTALNAIMDSPESALLTLPTGETIAPHYAGRNAPSNFQVVGTQNGSPDDLPASLRDRWDARILVDDVHPGSIAALPEGWQETARGMVDPSARKAGRGTSPRDWHSLAMLTSRGVSLIDAAAMVWDESRAGEVIDHLTIAGVEVAAMLTPPAPEPVAAALGALGIPTGGGLEFRCKDCGHSFAAGKDADGVTYPDETGAVYCGECSTFWSAEEARACARGEIEVGS